MPKQCPEGNLQVTASGRVLRRARQARRHARHARHGRQTRRARHARPARQTRHETSFPAGSACSPDSFQSPPKCVDKVALSLWYRPPGGPTSKTLVCQARRARPEYYTLHCPPDRPLTLLLHSASGWADSHVHASLREEGGRMLGSQIPEVFPGRGILRQG